MVKLQLSLTDQEASLLASYGSLFGYNVTKTAKFILSKTVDQILREGLIPTYPLDDELEKEGLKELKEYKAGKTTKIDDVEKFFDSL